jgi:hypothetical protein
MVKPTGLMIPAAKQHYLTSISHPIFIQQQIYTIYHQQQEHNTRTTHTNAKKRAQQQNDKVTTQKMRSNLSKTL